MKSYVIYKNQTEGLRDVSETVKTVEKIAASAVHFLRQKVSTLDIYTAETERALSNLSKFYQKRGNSLLQKRKTGKRMLVVLTGDKGLVGGLWHKTINTFLKSVKEYQSVVVVGSKAGDYLKEENIPIAKMFSDFLDIPNEDQIRSVSNYIFDAFKNGGLSRVDILYPKFVSLSEQNPSFILFLPFEFSSMEIADSGEKNDGKDNLPKEIKIMGGKENGEGFPVFEPSKEKIFDELLQKYIGVFFHKIMMETKLSELSARTVATEHAATKTDDIIKKLRLDYAKERRRSVTQRQLESFAAHKTI